MSRLNCTVYLGTLRKSNRAFLKLKGRSASLGTKYRTQWLHSERNCSSLHGTFEAARKTISNLTFLQKTGICFAVFAVFVSSGGVFIWYQTKLLHHTLQVTNNVFEVERYARFIYLNKRDKLPYTGQHGGEVDTPSLQGKLKKSFGKLIPWLQAHTKDPWVLMRLTQSPDLNTRLLGIKSLADNHDWDDFQYRYVSQACDNRTMVSLARMANTDHRLFRKLPILPPMKTKIIDDLFKLLGSFPTTGIDPCLSEVTSKAFETGNIEAEKGSMLAFGGTGIEFVKTISREPDDDIENFFLDAFARHCAVRDHCVQFVQRGGLQLLMRIYFEKPRNVGLHSLIAWTLGNVSLHPDLQKHLLNGGWIPILHDWMKSRDPALCFHSARALANLDKDTYTDVVYPDGIYLAHPIHKELSPVKVDIVLVHGLMGGPFKTWRQQDRLHVEGQKALEDKDYVKNYTFCWPKEWLGKDCSNIRVLSVGYDTELSQWNAKCKYGMEKRSIAQQSAKLIEKLMDADIGGRPIIWMGHSMGGLLIKKMLEVASKDNRYRHIVDETIGTVFYSTPHTGSTMERFGNYKSFVFSPSIEVRELSNGNPMLLTLHKNFIKLMEEEEIPCLSFGESVKTSFGLNISSLIVNPDSSNPGIGEFFKMPLNHINVCKPWDSESELYVLTLEFIRKCIKEMEDKKAKQLLKTVQESNK